MPIYEYRCKKCGRRIEAMQSINDPPLRTHDDCGGPLQKVYLPAGIIFRGSGFYSTDSRSSKKEKPAKDGGSKKSSDSED